MHGVILTVLRMFKNHTGKLIGKLQKVRSRKCGATSPITCTCTCTCTCTHVTCTCTSPAAMNVMLVIIVASRPAFGWLAGPGFADVVHSPARDTLALPFGRGAATRGTLAHRMSADSSNDRGGLDEDEEDRMRLVDEFRCWRDLKLPRYRQRAVPTTAVGAAGLCRGAAVGGPGRRFSGKAGSLMRRRVVRWRQSDSTASSPSPPTPSFLSAMTFPALTLLAAYIGVAYPVACAPFGSLVCFRYGLSSLMLSMGLSLAPADLRRALSSPKELVLNAALCFGAMPLVALMLARLLRLSPPSAAGLVLLGAVSGGQASNLCALLAGGDLALSIVLTVSTTTLGAIATPALVQGLLGATVAVDGAAVWRSICQLVLLPLACGVALGQRLPSQVARWRPWLPRMGITALLLLVMGGSANAAAMLLGSTGAWRAHAAAILLPLAGGAVALCAAREMRLDERAARTIAIETAIKSPTLAFVLARTHFNEAATAAVPAASMVWLAAIGAVAASIWGRCDSRDHSAHPRPRSDER